MRFTCELGSIIRSGGECYLSFYTYRSMMRSNEMKKGVMYLSLINSRAHAAGFNVSLQIKLAGFCTPVVGKRTTSRRKVKR